MCGASLEGRRRHAIYCSDGCRSAGRDRARAARKFDPDRPPCPVCGQSMAGRREGAIYCSPVCRARAWSDAHSGPGEGDDIKAPRGRMQKRNQPAVHRVTLTKPEAAAALGISVDSFERHVQPELRMIRRGRMRLIPLHELERWATRTRHSRSRKRSDDGRTLGAQTANARRERRTDGGRDRKATFRRPADRGRTGAVQLPTPSYEAWVYSPRDGRKLRRTFANYAEARSWRADAKRQIDQGSLAGAEPADAAARPQQAWLAGAEAGEIRNRSGDPYKPSTLRGYRHALEERVLPLIGGEKLSAITTSDLQLLVDRWQAEGLPASTLRNIIKPLQAIYRRAKSRGGLPVNPTRDLELPARGRGEVEIVSPTVADEAACRATRRGSTASGRRRCTPGCATASCARLRWDAVDVAGGTIEVRESWDAKAGRIDPKTRTSRRRVPMPAALRELLLDRRLEEAKRRERRTRVRALGRRSRSTRRRSTGERTPPGRPPGQRAAAAAPGEAHLRLVHDRRRGQREGARRSSWATRRSR